MNSRIAHIWWVVLAGMAVGLTPKVVAVAGIAAGPRALLIMGAIALVMLAWSWAVVSISSLPRGLACAAFVGAIVITGGAMAGLEGARPRSNAPASTPPSYTASSLPWILAPLAAGVAGVVLSRWTMRRVLVSDDPSACAGCGFPIDVLIPGPCPECGLDRDAGTRRRATRKERHERAAIGVAVLLVGLIVLGCTVAPAARQLRSLSYPSVVADQYEIFGTYGPSRNWRRSRRPIIKAAYGYTVSGTQYTAERVSYVQQRFVGPQLPPLRVMTLPAAKRHAERIITAGPIVYYNPTNPADATLTRGLDGGVLRRLFLGAAAVAFGLAASMPLGLGVTVGRWPRPFRVARAGLKGFWPFALGGAAVITALTDLVGVPVGGLVALPLLVISLAGAVWFAYARQ